MGWGMPHPMRSPQSTPEITPRARTLTVNRAVTSDDLLRLRDFGDMGVSIGSKPFEATPRGDWIALQIRQANAATDNYCTAIILVSVDGRRTPEVIDDGGEIVAAYSTAYGAAEVPKGVPKSTLLRWSPDGTSLAYTKVYADHSEIWRFDLADHSTRWLAKSAVDIEELSWSSDGSAIIYASRPGRLAALEAIKTEGRGGYRYDSRFRPLYSDRPLIAAEIPLINRAIDAFSGEDVALPGASSGPPGLKWPDNSVAYAQAPKNDAVAWSASTGPGYRAQPRLGARVNGREVRCTSDSCVNVSALWWADDGKSLIYQRRAGTADSRTEFYVWRPGRSKPRRLIVTAAATPRIGNGI